MVRKNKSQKSLFETKEVEEEIVPEIVQEEEMKELPPLITIKVLLKDVKEVGVEKNVKMIVDKLKIFSVVDVENPAYEFKYNINVSGVY